MDKLDVPCGHGVWIVATEEGTNYCGWCAFITEIESLRQQLTELTLRREETIMANEYLTNQLAELRAALNWYAEHAIAAKKYLVDKKGTNADSLIAILTTLALDGGDRSLTGKE